MSALLRYDEACRAVAAARSIDEARDLASKADAVKLWARQAKNRSLERDAAEIRIRAERRLGEIILREKAAGAFAAHRPKNNPQDDGGFSARTLADVGVDHNLSSRAQATAAIPEERFEVQLAQWREKCERDASRITASLVRDNVKAAARAAHAERAEAGCTVDDLHALAASGRTFGMIMADPPWRFQTRSALGDDRSASQHYHTDTIAGIAALPVRELAAENCVLLLWSVWPSIRAALDLIDHWGFEYSTIGLDWMKLWPSGEPVIGNGFWFRANSEPCLLGLKGSPLRLDAGVPSALLTRRGEHSAKPDEAYERAARIAAGPYLELYARRPRDGWTVWGDEIPKGGMGGGAPPSSGGD